MKYAIRLAQKALKLNEVPVGCVIVDTEKKLISSAHNMVIEKNDPSAHAELLAIKKACKKLKTTKLIGLELYTTLEPCLMCETLIVQTGIKKVYFGTYSDSLLSFKKKIRNYHFHKKNYEYFGGIDQGECSNLLIRFFQKLRN